MAVGITSFVDCAMFTRAWSPRFPPRSSHARFAITSFTFMWKEVPAPAWYASTTKSRSCLPARTSSAACTMASPFFRSRAPTSMLARAAAILMRATARTISTWRRSPEIGKFTTARAVWTP